jgi:hypothetical protein
MEISGTGPYMLVADVLALPPFYSYRSRRARRCMLVRMNSEAPINSEWLITELLDEKPNAKYCWQYHQRGPTKDWVLAIDIGTGTDKILNVSESQLDAITAGDEQARDHLLARLQALLR